MKVRYLILIALGLLIATEVSLRLIISMPSTQQFDGELGYTNIPGSQMIESWEGYSHITFNRIGFNDDDPDDAIERKVFVVGDSYTEAFQLDKKLGYTSLLENKLTETDVIKLARDSFWPLHYPIVSNRFYDDFTPELTILQLGSHTLSDLTAENISIAFHDNGDIEDYRVSVSQNDRRKESFRVVINNSATAYYLMRKYKNQIVTSLSRLKNIFSGKSEKKKGSKKKKRIGEQEYTKRLEYILRQIKGRVLVLYIPSPRVLHDSDTQNDRVRNVVKMASQNTGLDLLDMTDDFKSSYSLTGQFLNGFANSKPGEGHLNERGHQLVAEKLSEKIKQLGL